MNVNKYTGWLEPKKESIEDLLNRIKPDSSNMEKEANKEETRMKFVDEDISKFSIIKADNEELCRVCKENTPYIEYCYEARICGTECLDATNSEIMGEVHKLENLEE